VAFQKTLNRRLLKASEDGCTEIVKALLDKGADANAENNFALFCASVNGHTEIVKLLLEAGADVHAVHNQALRWASHRGQTEIVKLLRAARLFLPRQSPEQRQGLRMLTLRDVLSRWEAAELSQPEAAELLGVSARTFRRYRRRICGNHSGK
jgi:hypothetical protein